ncbi:Protein of unknown function [Amycolatopsis arida]|uniref:DUF998 domain-containing protein n=2 Tax=Amycolatopsis arida TaxID=587909 RepID=A0A1I5YY09_9PSEU|nr:uncharacterized protein DUF998 [Amycolatopsis arida]SFQ49084.1 Protein of unknown function [Amycolatopsis arida]
MTGVTARDTTVGGRAAALLPRLALAGLATGVALMVLLQLLPPTSAISPTRRTISEYGLTSNKWLFDLAVLLVAAGSAVAFAALVRRRLVRPISAATVFGTLWSLGLLAVVAFPKTDWAVGPSVAGSIHRWASVVAFVCLPVAVIAAARAAFAHSPGRRRVVQALGVLSLLWFGLILAAVARWLAGGEPWWRALPLGLVERLMALTEVLAVAALALGLARHGGVPPTAAGDPSGAVTALDYEPGSGSFRR